MGIIAVLAGRMRSQAASGHHSPLGDRSSKRRAPGKALLGITGGMAGRMRSQQSLGHHATFGDRS
jgi:hypothetical protein